MKVVFHHAQRKLAKMKYSTVKSNEFALQNFVWKDAILSLVLLARFTIMAKNTNVFLKWNVLFPVWNSMEGFIMKATG